MRDDLLFFKDGEPFVDKYTIRSNGGSDGSGCATRLGEGGSSVVYIAEQELHDNVVVKRAIKLFVYRDDIADMSHHAHSGPVSARHFKEELVPLSNLSHENVLKVIEAGFYTPPGHDDLQVPYLVTEFVEGPTFKAIIQDRSLQSFLKGNDAHVIDLILQVCRGVRYLHGSGFYHCDIAPKNVFLRGEYPDLQVVIGDLGLARSKRANPDDRFIVVGSKQYCPPPVIELLHKEIAHGEFSKLQPKWDVFGTAKTALELLRTVTPREQADQRWLSAVDLRLQRALEEDAEPDIGKLERSIDWLRPVQHTMAGVAELGTSYQPFHRMLLPIEPIPTSPRIRRLMYHPAVLRLKRVPQLVMASAVFPGATHSRYEHALGVYQVARRFLIALLRDPYFLATFDQEHIELCLVASLLANSTRFPFSTIVHEIKSSCPDLFQTMSRRSLLHELLHSEKYADGKGRTLLAVINEYFPHIDEEQAYRLLSDSQDKDLTLQERFILFLLNSSLDARVLDYLRRDSIHLGTSTGNDFDLDELLPHLAFDRKGGRFVVGTRAMSVVEQVISLRYWLFSRIYWNSPNRSLIAMLRHTLVALARDGRGFEAELRGRALHDTEAECVAFLKEQAASRGMRGVEQICEFLDQPRPKRFDELHQFNRSEGGAMARHMCNVICKYSSEELQKLEERINESVILSHQLDEGQIHVLVDVPVERGSLKLGDDLEVVTHDGGVLQLSEMSGVVSGVQRGFEQHLQRVRIFINPNLGETLKGEERDRLKEQVLQVLRASVAPSVSSTPDVRQGGDRRAK